ncbi:MAG TPA: RluA family pseudouridine synthase [Armatimonadota bacterium]|nr:RluA family pseudouridine synthase [Armatimonadota bacterium]
MPSPSHPLPADIQLLYDDDLILVVSKPQGMAVHPAPGSRRDTLVQWLRQWYEDRGFPDRHVAAVSRLDKGTSGLILLATDAAAHPNLHHQVTRHQIHREYTCLVRGRPLFEETTVDAPLGRHWIDSRRMAVYDVPPAAVGRWGARPAITHLRVLRRFDGAALLAATLQTGRMHQIRVHCQFIRHPIVGDRIYGAAMLETTAASGSEGLETGEDRLNRLAARLEWQCLHAGRLEFRHPLTSELLTFESPLPPPFANLLTALSSTPASTTKSQQSADWNGRDEDKTEYGHLRSD